MRILFTICGRAGSKGIKNKNIRPFLGKPLPLYAISAIDLFLKDHTDVKWDIAVNTDSPELEDIVCNNGKRKASFVPRKEEMAGDSAGKIHVIRDTLNEMEKNGEVYDMVIDMDITSPLRRKDDVAAVFQEAKKDIWDAVFTVTECRRNPYFNMVKSDEEGGYKRVITSAFLARQQAPEVYDMNASIYAYKPDFLKKTDSLFDGKCGVVKMYDTGILDLDHENDFELMEIIGEYLFRTNSDFKKIFSNI